MTSYVFQGLEGLHRARGSFRSYFAPLVFYGMSDGLTVEDAACDRKCEPL